VENFFIVPAAAFRVLFVFIVLAHDRRRIVHFNVTEYPTAQWTAQQIVAACPFDTVPSYLNSGRRWHSRRARCASALQRKTHIALAPAAQWLLRK